MAEGGTTRAEGLRILRRMYGKGAEFRDGQWEAVERLLAGEDLLIVRPTGWGKSLVYFLASRMLRKRGAGPTLLISPLLSLMRDQERLASEVGVRARALHSANRADWLETERKLARDEVDVLLVAPERLGAARFREETLPMLRRRTGLVVVDEAHCISEWGHDFRPDYRRIGRLIGEMPSETRLLATTATAGTRVIEDIRASLRPGLTVARGPLARESLRLQVIALPRRAERLAWLAASLPRMSGSGVVYCLTVRDCESVSAWLARCGIDAPAYHAELPSEERPRLEDALQRNAVKALCATVALGMGFDKPDLGFVVHFQRPASLVAYYQQIGRAGRALTTADAVLLLGEEDDAIAELFIDSAFPDASEVDAVLEAVRAARTTTVPELLRRTNLPERRLDRCIAHLAVEGAVLRGARGTLSPGHAWEPDWETSARITARRREELARMSRLGSDGACLMESVLRGLDDPWAARCGRCAVCAPPHFPTAARGALVRAALRHAGARRLRLAPHAAWPPDALHPFGWEPPEELRNREGRCLGWCGDECRGDLAVGAKYRDRAVPARVTHAAARLVARRWRPPVAWVTAIPSARRPEFVPGFAERLARALRLPFRAALSHVEGVPPQKDMRNAVTQVENVSRALAVVPEAVLEGAVLLVDDLVDSGWTLSVAGRMLLEAGSGPVYPLALAATRTSRVVR